MMPDTGSRGRPLKTAEDLAAGDALGEAVERYRRVHPNEAVTQPTPPKRQRPLVAITTPTPIPGYPLGPSRPDVEIPTYGSRAAAIDASRGRSRRANGTVILDLIGPPELRKRDTMSGATDTRGITSEHR
jgi:hypothetical protein